MSHAPAHRTDWPKVSTKPTTISFIINGLHQVNWPLPCNRARGFEVRLHSEVRLEGVRFMANRQKFKKAAGRAERHSAAWGKRLSLIVLLATSVAYGQSLKATIQPSRGFSGLSPELTRLSIRLGAASNAKVNVI